MCCERTKLLEKIKEYLDKNGVEYSFDEPRYYTGAYGTWIDNASIDHTEDLPEIINDICGDEIKLLRYLFSEESFVLTGNDNDDEDVDINVDYEHVEYYKGN